MRYVFIILGFFIFIPVFSQTESDYRALELTYLNKQYDSLLVMSERLLSQDSLSWKPYFYRGKALAGKNRYFGALEAFEMANVKDTSNPIVENSLAEIYDFIGRDEDAISIYYDQYLRDTMKLEPIVNLGNIFRRKREYAAAIHYYQKAVSSDPENFYYYKQLAYCFDKINITSGAIYMYQAAIRLNPFDASLYIQLANIYNSERNFNQAIRLCNEGANRFPQNTQLPKIEAYAHYLNKNFAQAVNGFDSLIARGDSSLFNLKYRGLAYFELKAFERAVEDLQKAVELSETDPEVCFFLGSALGRTDNTADAIKYLNKSLNIISPSRNEVANIYSEMAHVYLRQEKYAISLEFLKKAYKQDATPVLSFKMAQLYDYYLQEKKLAINYYDGYLTMVNSSDSSGIGHEKFYSDSAMVENAKVRIRTLNEEIFFEQTK